MERPFDRSYHVSHLNTTGSPSSAATTATGTSEEQMNNATTPTEQLASFCFPADFDLSAYYAKTTKASNTSHKINNSSSSSSEETMMSLDDLHGISNNCNKHISKTTVSRQGRDLQRFEGNSEHGVVARLTTGTVPIFKDGRILLISSNKGGCVLPKGGWEEDESLPAAAIRETFEEAGVFGVLGQPFPSLTYETRKAQRKRLDHERESASPCYFSDETVSSINSSSKSSVDRYPIATTNGPVITPDSGSRSSRSSSSSKTNNVRRPEHTHNRMTIFPLYVQQVCEEWPETQRRRIAVTIDEAERLLQNRPEFLSILRQLKEHGMVIQKAAV